MFLEEEGSGLTMVAAIVFVLCMALLLVPFYAKLSAARAEQQAVADQTALAGANAVARAKTSLMILDGVDYKFSEYIAATTMLLASLAALTLVPYVGEVAASLIEPVGDLLRQLVSWKRSFDSKVAEPARRGMRKVAPAYAMALSARIAAGNGYVGVAIPYPLSEKKEAPSSDDRSGDSEGRDQQDAVSTALEVRSNSKRLALLDRRVSALIASTKDEALSLAQRLKAPNGDARRQAQGIRDQALSVVQDAERFDEVAKSLLGDGGIIDLADNGIGRVSELEADVISSQRLLIEALEQWQADHSVPSLDGHLGELRRIDQRLSQELAERNRLFKESEQALGKLKTISTGEQRALAQARTQLIESGDNPEIPGSDGVIAVVYKHGAAVANEGRMRPIAISAAAAVENPAHELDLWGDTRLIGDSRLASGISEVANMLKAADKLLAWARVFGGMALKLIGAEPPKAFMFEPVLVNTATVDKEGLVGRLHQGRDSIYGQVYTSLETTDDQDLKAGLDVWSARIRNAARDWDALQAVFQQGKAGKGR